MTLGDAFHLTALAPNPAQQRSAFALQVRQAQPVRVAVFDVMGRHLHTLFEGTLDGGVNLPLTLDVAHASGVCLDVRRSRPRGR